MQLNVSKQSFIKGPSINNYLSDLEIGETGRIKIMEKIRRRAVDMLIHGRPQTLELACCSKIVVYNII